MQRQPGKLRNLSHITFSKAAEHGQCSVVSSESIVGEQPSQKFGRIVGNWMTSQVVNDHGDSCDAGEARNQACRLSRFEMMQEQ